MEKIIPVAIILATMLEAEPFIKAFKLEETAGRPFPTYGGNDIILVISGIGKANGAMGTAYTCMKYSPGFILNLGAAGATENYREPGSFYHIEKTLEPDRPHIRTNTPYIQIPEILEGFKTAILATQDRPIVDIRTFREISAYADLVDMEGASVIQAAKKFNKKSFLFKFVSDTPANAGEGQIMEQIKIYRDPFCDFIVDSVIHRLKLAKKEEPTKQVNG